MIKEWYSAAELTGKPGLPGTVQAIWYRAKKDSWVSREREAQGGGKEYHLDSLPPETQKSLRISHAKRSVSFERGAATAAELLASEQAREEVRRERLGDGLRDYMKLRGQARNRADAKACIVFAAQDFMRTSGMSGRSGIDTFTCAYNTREINVSDEVRAIVPSFSSRSLYNWINTNHQEGVAALAGKYGKHRKGSGVIDRQPALAEYVIGMVVEYPHMGFSTLLKAVKAEFSGQPILLPSITTLERWVHNWKRKNAQVFTAITNPDAWKNKYMAAPGSASEHVVALNQLWEFDATPADVMLTDGRYSLSGVIDVYSRRLKLLVTRTANSKAVSQVIRAAILDWGVPEVAKTDNGADYKSKYIKSVFHKLGIEQEFCPPFQGWKKPHIERAFRTFSHDIAELLDGFVGHNVTERKAIESRKAFSDRLFEKDAVIDVNISSTELQAFCDQWVDNYHHDTHSGLGKAPVEMVRNWNQPIRRIDDERLLDVLLSEPAGTRVVGKKGIKLDSGIYVHADLGGLIGDDVHLYYDDRDMGRVYVYDANGEFVCIAEDPTITGVSRSEVAAKTKEAQREAVQEERRRLKAAAKKVTKRDVAQQILDHRSDEIRRQNTIEFPKRTEQHRSDGLDAAEQALHAGQQQQVAPTPAPATTPAQQLAELIALTPRAKTEESGQQLYERWLRLDAQIKRGVELEGRDTSFYKTYRDTAEFETYEQLNAMGILQLHG